MFCGERMNCGVRKRELRERKRENSFSCSLFFLISFFFHDANKPVCFQNFCLTKKYTSERKEGFDLSWFFAAEESARARA